MNKCAQKLFTALVLLALSTFNSQFSICFAQDTAFTYQGRLNDAGSPANGTHYGMVFYLYDAPTNGNLKGNLGIVSVMVSNGLFTVPLDFGAVFDGTPRWLEISVQKNGGGFTALTPRQKITPTPYAIFANTASNLSGTLSAAQLSGPILSANISGTYGGALSLNNVGNSFSGSGIGLTGVNAAALNGLNSSNFWQTAGNAGTSPAHGNFVGTSDNQPLELRVNGGRALRLEPGATNGAPNLIGGSPVNYVSGGVVGATIAGGGATNFFGPGYTNRVLADFGVIGGGLNNSVVNDYATVAGGIGNSAGGGSAAVGGGAYNYAGNDYSAVGGGFANSAAGMGAFIGGGGYDGNTYQGNQTAGNASFIGGGLNNNINAGADYSAVISGQGNIMDVNSYDSLVAGGSGNWIGANTVYSFIGGGLDNSMLISGGGGGNIIGGGENNSISTSDGSSVGNSIIAGGVGNNIQGDVNTISGGMFNYATNSFSTVGGGMANVASGQSATVAGGGQLVVIFPVDKAKPAAGVGGGGGNTASGDYSFVGGGRRNVASGFSSTIAGGDGNTASLDDAVIGGGWGNVAQNADATISGGDNNTAGGCATTVAGGEQNNAGGDYSMVGGGTGNNGAGAGDVLAGGYNNSSGGGNNSTISGGNNNNSSGSDAVIGGGQANHVSAFFTTIGGGINNVATNDTAVVSGGTNNVGGGYAATVAGGSDNLALGDYSFAAGNFAEATNNNAFVWSDGSTNTVSTTNNQFVARAVNGFVFYSDATSTGVSLAPGSGSWSTMSDRNAKKDFAPVNAEAVLARLAALPMTTWSYKTEPGVRHVGPMAQDFHAAFAVGEDDRHITEVDEGGVALAAIQGLNLKMQEQTGELKNRDAEIQNLKQQNDALEKRLNKLEQAIQSLTIKN